MRITSKGQVTIPVAIREKAGLLPNTEVEFRWDGGAVTLVKLRKGKRKSRGDEIVDRLRGSAPKPGLTTDELMALTRGE